jgi:hypothetical protein
VPGYKLKNVKVEKNAIWFFFSGRKEREGGGNDYICALQEGVLYIR